MGKAIIVKVRNGKQEDLIQIHMKETFQVLVDKYRALKKLAKSKKIVLEFDGEPLALGDTPQNRALESWVLPSQQAIGGYPAIAVIATKLL